MDSFNILQIQKQFSFFLIEVYWAYNILLISGKLYWSSLVAQLVKNLPATQEIWVRSLGQEDEDPLGKEIATHCSILAWRIPCTEEPGRLQSMRLQVRHDLATKPQPPHSDSIFSKLYSIQSYHKFWLYFLYCI